MMEELMTDESLDFGLSLAKFLEGAHPSDALVPLILSSCSCAKAAGLDLGATRLLLSELFLSK